MTHEKLKLSGGLLSSLADLCADDPYRWVWFSSDTSEFITVTAYISIQRVTSWTHKLALINKINVTIVPVL
jgi:bacteriorhodopsin